MSSLNFGTYENQISLLNDSVYGYLLQDDLYAVSTFEANLVKDLYVSNGRNWSQVKQSYVYDDGAWRLSYRKAYRFYIEISSTFTNFDLLTYLRGLSTPWDGVSPIKGIFKITNSAVLGSNATSMPALNISQLPDNSSLVIVNEGSIYGQGGNGGQGAAIDRNGFNGFNGGNSITIEKQLVGSKVYLSTSSSSKIWAGGGGGGGGAYSYEGSVGGSDTRSAGGGGGGGQGYSVSSGGPGGPLPNPSGAFGGRNAAGSPGSNGSFASAGAGGGGGGPSHWGPCAGGSGGNWGTDGATGQAVTAGNQDTNPGIGGKSGFCIDGSSNLIYLNNSPNPVNGYINNDIYKGRI